MTESAEAPAEEPQSRQDTSPQPAPYPPPPWVPKNGLGIASLVVAIVALLSVWSILGGVIGGMIAAGLGLVGRRRVRRGQANNGGVAIAGTVLGILAIVIGLAFIPLWAGFWQFVGGADYVDCMQTTYSDPVRQQRCVDEFRQNIEEKFGVTVTPAPPR